MAKVTVTLSMDQASELRRLVGESLELCGKVLTEPGLIAERKAQGSDGDYEQKYLENRYGLLETIRRELS